MKPAFLAVLVLLALPPVAQITAQDAETRARAVVAALVAGDFGKVEGQYDEQLARALPPGALGTSWTGSARQLGPFEAITGVQLQTAAGTTMVAVATCTFQNFIVTFRMAFNDKGQLSGLASLPPTPRASWSAPDYADPASFEERAVVIRTGRWELPGVVTMPKAGGPHAAVVLVHGSGPNDMDESLGPNKMFKDLAYGLATRGIAVLRYEKRTHKYGAGSSDDAATSTVKDEVIDDARAAVALLASTADVDPRRIFLAGHSEGGYLAPRIASGTTLAGIVLLAGNARPLEDLVVEQVRYQASLAGAMTPAIQKAIDDAEASAREMRNPDLKPGMNLKLLSSSLPASYVLDLRAYRPTDVAAALRIPIFVLQGERDYQVTMTDFGMWQKALAGRASNTFKSYPGLNHFFMIGTGPASPADYLKAGHVDVKVIDDLAAWYRTVVTSR